MGNEHFWNLVSGIQGCQNHHYKGLNISHLVLHCIQWAIASTIFVRDETVARANENDLMLLDNMVRPDDELEQPDLMLIMIHHWLEIQQAHRSGGAITLDGYVSHIVEHLEYQIQGDTLYRGPTSLDADSFCLADFIHLQKDAVGHRDRYYWNMPDGTHQHQLPFPAPLSFEDRSTWLFIGPRVTPPPPTPVVNHPMPEVPISSQQVHASSSSAVSSYPLSDPTIQDVYRLMYDMRHEQGAILRDLQYRVSSIEDELREWWMFDEYDSDHDSQDF